MNSLFEQRPLSKVKPTLRPFEYKSSSSSLDNIFYMQEYREQIFMLLKDYDNTKMTRWEKT